MFENPTLIDLTLTNVKNGFKDAQCIDTGLSYYHYVVFAKLTKLVMPVITKKPTYITRRSYKQFNIIDLFAQCVAEIFDNVDDSYWVCNELIKLIIDKHAPLKENMNSGLRKAINIEIYLE